MKVSPSRIVAARKRAQVTQRELAEALGVTVQAVSQWENGKTDPSSRIAQMSEFLRCPISFLTGELDEETPTNLMPPLSSVDYIIDIIDINDLGKYISSDNRERESLRILSATSTIAPVGWLFGLKVTSSSKHFNEGDILIFDNGIKPDEGDYAAMLILSEKRGRVSFTKEGNVQIHGAQGIVTHLIDGPFETFEPAPIDLSPNVHVDAELGPMVLAGTLVERRTFRKPPGPSSTYRSLSDPLDVS